MITATAAFRTTSASGPLCMGSRLAGPVFRLSSYLWTVRLRSAKGDASAFTTAKEVRTKTLAPVARIGPPPTATAAEAVSVLLGAWTVAA